jgi:hypothetical protein
MSGSDGQASPGPGAVVPPNHRTIIPLMPGVARPRGERRAAMQQAVIEVIRHLVLEAVPPEHRTPLFDQARDLLSEAGWARDELSKRSRRVPRAAPCSGRWDWSLRPEAATGRQA